MTTTYEIPVAEFIQWLRTQPADAEYNFFNPENCALAQFGKSRFPDNPVTAGAERFYVYKVGDIEHAKPEISAHKVTPLLDFDWRNLVSHNSNFHALAADLEAHAER